MSHADDVNPGDLLHGPMTGERTRRTRRTRRWWLLLAWLAVTALAVTEVTVQVQHFLWGSPLAYVSPGFGTSGAFGSGGFGSPFDTPVVSPDGRTLYVPSGTNSITPVDTATRKTVPRIRISGRGSVAAMAITPDSLTLFAAMIDVNATTEPGLPLARIDLRTGREMGQVEVPGGAGNFVMSRDGKTLYIVSTFRYIVDRNNNPTGQVDSALYAVNAATRRTERQLPVPPNLLDDEAAMVLSPDGGTLYLADEPDSGQNTVASVSLRTGEPGSLVDLGTRPTALAITPDGRTLYVTTSGMQGEEQQGPNSVTAIDTATDQVRATLIWKAQPVYLTMAPDGKTVWVVSVTGANETTADNTVTPVSVATDKPGPSFHTSGWLNYQGGPSAAAISPDSQTLYVAVRSGLETFRVGLPSAQR